MMAYMAVDMIRDSILSLEVQGTLSRNTRTITMKKNMITNEPTPIPSTRVS